MEVSVYIPGGDIAHVPARIAPVTEAQRERGRTRDGYSTRRGVPTDLMVRITDRWSRVYLQNSGNGCTCLATAGGVTYVVDASGYSI